MSLDIDVSLVTQLVATQFPQWAQLPISPVANSGWDNRTFHLGDAMLVRLPSPDYPWPWSIYGWLEGDYARRGNVTDLDAFAVELAKFVLAQMIETNAIEAGSAQYAIDQLINDFHRLENC